MRIFLAVVLCKCLYFIGKLLGRGSNLPGRIVLALFPGILAKVKLPNTVIAVTGSNGKTSTTEMIARVLTQSGKTIAWNHEGANEISGMATLLLRSARINGVVKRDVVVMECDERYAQKIFAAVKPTIVVVTNLFRDQLTRNGHHEFVQACIRNALDVAGASTTLVLNADDPYVAALGIGHPKVRWFGIGDSEAVKDIIEAAHAVGKYDDGAFCPVCKARMNYSYRINAHLGDYQCTACSLARPAPDYSPDTTEAPMQLAFPSLSNAYNWVTAVAATATAGIPTETAAQALNNYALTGGRTVQFSVEGRKGLLLVSKHENSVSYNQSLALAMHSPCTVVVLVDEISRKYYTAATSWLWDVDFDMLTRAQHIVLAGRYVNDLAARFAMTDINPQKIGIVADPAQLRTYVARHTQGEICAVTCFSDKDKLLKAFAREIS